MPETMFPRGQVRWCAVLSSSKLYELTRFHMSWHIRCFIVLYQTMSRVPIVRVFSWKSPRLVIGEEFSFVRAMGHWNRLPRGTVKCNILRVVQVLDGI